MTVNLWEPAKKPATAWYYSSAPDGDPVVDSQYRLLAPQLADGNTFTLELVDQDGRPVPAGDSGGVRADGTFEVGRPVGLPAGSDISRLRAQIGGLDREVRRLTVQLETERRNAAGPQSGRRTEPADADDA